MERRVKSREKGSAFKTKATRESMDEMEGLVTRKSLNELLRFTGDRISLLPFTVFLLLVKLPQPKSFYVSI